MMSKGWHITYIVLLLILTMLLFLPQNLKQQMLAAMGIQHSQPDISTELPLEEALNTNVATQDISRNIVEVADPYQGNAPRLAVILGTQQPKMLETARYFQNKGWNVVAVNNMPLLDANLHNMESAVQPLNSESQNGGANPTTNKPIQSGQDRLNNKTVKPPLQAAPATANLPEPTATATQVNDNSALPTAAVPSIPELVPAQNTDSSSQNDDPANSPAVMATEADLAEVANTGTVEAEPTINPGALIVVQRQNESNEYLQEIANAVESYGGKIDTLVVSDQDTTQLKLLAESTPEEYQRELNTNVLETITVLKTLLPYLQNNVGSRIIYLSALGSKIGMPMFSIYNVSRFALSGLFESLYYELQGLGIEVKIVALDSLSVDLEKNNFRDQVSGQYTTNLEAYRPFTAKVIESIGTITNQDLDDELMRLSAQLVYKAAIDPENKFYYFEGGDQYSLSDKLKGNRNRAFKTKVGEQFGLVKIVNTDTGQQIIQPIGAAEMEPVPAAPQLDAMALEAAKLNPEEATQLDPANSEIADNNVAPSTVDNTAKQVTSETGVISNTQPTTQNTVNSNSGNLPNPPTIPQPTNPQPKTLPNGMMEATPAAAPAAPKV